MIRRVGLAVFSRLKEHLAPTPPTVAVSREGETAVVRLSGSFRLASGLPAAGDVIRALESSPPPQLVQVDVSGVDHWDTAMVAFLARVYDACTARNVALDLGDVPRVARQILGMARQGAVLGGTRLDEPEERRIGDQFAKWARGWARLSAGAVGLPTAGPATRPQPLVDTIGQWTIDWVRSLGGKIDFFGSTVIAIVRMLVGRTRRLRSSFLLYFQQGAVETLPIVALMGFAIGAVLTIIISGQLQKVGATALAARIVSIAVLREMGSLMVGIAIAGRLGSAIAAEIATMVANDETDVLHFIGVDHFDYLVAPRVIATALSGMLLVIYANAFGLAGGLFTAVTLAGLPAEEFIGRSRDVMGYKHFTSGLIKGLAFGTATALVACYHGLRSGRSAGAVGVTVRRAVVGAVVGVVLADAVITLVFKWIKL
jgi:phospholipid/cholesterol/gamma-HCH transport system permease protein